VWSTDPLDPDSDDGGVEDGAEVGRGTDPLNLCDDLEDNCNERIEGGVYRGRVCGCDGLGGAAPLPLALSLALLVALRRRKA
jgi:uncharacterized protein (TIGR03382 family)